MHYVESLNLFGVDAKEIPCKKGTTAPTTATKGAVGLFYMDTTTGDLYKCTKVAGDVHTWEAIESGGGEIDLSNFYTAEEVDEKISEQAKLIEKDLDDISSDLGDIDTALDAILAIENELIGG